MPKLAYVPAEGWYPDKGEEITVQSLTCTPWDYYVLSFETKAAADGYCSVVFYSVSGQPLVDDIYNRIYKSQGWQKCEGLIRAREEAESFRFRLHNCGQNEFRNFEIRRVDLTGAEVWQDRLYASLPPIRPAADACRLDRLPRLKKILKEGGNVRIVMLGDSIINDTSNSNFEVLLSRSFPAVTFSVIISVRGSTGCWYYQDPEQLRTYVFEKKPDLLVIGGISHKRDRAAVESVIRQVQAADKCEILLLSGPMDKDWRKNDPDCKEAGLPAQTWERDSFNDELITLADETGIAMYDHGAAWHEYLGASCKPFEWFHRDAVHADDRGKQILGRLMHAYFAVSIHIV